MERLKTAQKRYSRDARVASTLGILVFLSLGVWAVSLVRESRAVQRSFDLAGAQAVQLTHLLESLTKVHQAGAVVLQTYAVGYQRIVFDKTYEQYERERLNPGVAWDASCVDCLRVLDRAVRAHRDQAARVFKMGEQWEALPPGSEKEALRKAVSDELFILEQREGSVLAAFQDLETVNRGLLASTLRRHQGTTRNLYALVGVTLLLALGFLGIAFLAWVQTLRSRRTERLAHTLMDVVPDGLIVWNEARTIIKANSAACRMVGLSEQELVGESVMRWVPSEICEQLEVFEATHGVPFAIPVGRHSSVPFEASVGSVHGEDGSVHVGSFRNISNRIKAERRMREAQKMEAVGALAAGVVHDVRNLLTPIGLAEELLSRDPDLTPSEQRLLQKIRKGIEAATSLMNQLLRLARKGGEEPRRVVNVHDCLQDTLALVRSTLGSGVILDMELAATSLHVNGHYEHLLQVFSNLFINAGHAMHGQGTLRIKTVNGDGSFEVVVADTGDGMTEEVRGHIFEPLFTTKGEHGTGLGLFNVKHTIDELGGQIMVSSVPGQGTEFRIKIPTTDPSASSAPS